MRDEFEKMHQYLHDEEATLMSQLNQEEEEKSHRMKEKIDRINDDIQVLINSMRETEDAMGFDNLLFLKVISTGSSFWLSILTDIICI